MSAVAQQLDDHADELAVLLTQEHGKPLANARTEVLRSAMWARELAQLTLDEAVLEDQFLVDDEDRSVVLRRVPLGVVAAIVPWNFPVSLAVWKIAPALLTGNTIILKPSPKTPLTGLYLGELLREVVPAGVVNVVTGKDDLGAWMTSHPGIDKIAFTGSTATVKKVMAAASERLARVTLELGGNDPAIVLSDRRQGHRWAGIASRASDARTVWQACTSTRTPSRLRTQVLAGSSHRALQPPSIVRDAPLIDAEAGEHTNATISATSSGSTSRLTDGSSSITCSTTSSGVMPCACAWSAICCSTSGVRT